ncbi:MULTISPECIES: FtsX-like permease family protein [unclassified Oleiphilus]|jgi:putative ABC transport system permease protein|uniref:ABC transporter permease n=3 Tax=Oleiphilus TaxID=141450 RepID=UPI0007C3FA30|nr:MULTISPECIES: FtsX-like permease family protein [unclassified Oleiphilus]KZY45856.1 peptide ABC transporter permease [Oleiphilus sp. HI0050]KZY87964.1 peptide ABC transporter permease [Oleiphilus sp. HI0069]KZY89069.1 peptide ABC transporter permease [Oleiphilus sp. HI0072]KZZ09547.1 peptide ABC transporter permease [Oleiphilus sp. HI0078]KZY64287.1 peptide ABC transporter permease [Oleiphilus sp. HI0061]
MNWALLMKLTLKSILNRKFTSGLTLFSICISVFLLLSVDTVRKEAKHSFTNTISGTDLLVGARSGSVQLLLYSVFRIGNATNNIGWDSYQKISSHKSVAWAIPISLGDSHKGYRVMGTTQDYFKHYRFADDRGLDFEQGKHFDGVYDAVIGAEIAESLGYKIGDQLTLAHGVNDTGFSRHDDKPFILTGILARTGTPVDRTIHVSLEGIEALHIDWQSGTQSRNKVTAEQTLEMDLQPKQITAFMLGLKSKMEIFRIQRAINKYKKEPLLAVLPGLALGELWQLIGVAEKALLIIAVFVLLNSFVGLLTGILSSLNERRREIAILRSLGCRPNQIFVLLASESLLFAVLGCALGLAVFFGAVLMSQSLLQGYGLTISLTSFGSEQLALVAAVVGMSLLIGCIPGYRAYKQSLADGMSIKL